MEIEIDHHLDLDQLWNAVHHGGQLRLSSAAESRIVKCRSFLDQHLADHQGAIYGINTGFGALHDVVIGPEDLSLLQANLVRSHACGMGEEIDELLVRYMIALKIQGLAYGHSGVQLKTVKLLCEFFNRNISPIVYAKGSLGASGDLAPLAHISLALLGEGEVLHKGKRTSASQALSSEGLEPVTLGSKEGLALLNGTQFMSAHAAYLVTRFERAMDWSLHIAAMSIDALDGHISPFDEKIHKVRPHAGQRTIAKQMRDILSGSEQIEQEKQHVQDPYCLRCIPQVLGASWDTLQYVRSIVNTEIGSVTDNPTIFPDEGEVISAGNFHGQPLALALDFLSIAMAEVGSISERRTYKLNAGIRGLPSFLVKAPGLNSGFMITQYTAASIASENKQLCNPASVDTIDSSQGQEDHVSMGANAATKAMKVLVNLEELLAIELFNAAQALEFRGVDKTSKVLVQLHERYRSQIPFVEVDVEMSSLMRQSRDFIKEQKPS